MKKNRVTNTMIVAGGIFILVLCGVFATIIFNSQNNTVVGRWFKTNFFPADEYALSSVLDVESSEVTVQEYRGSTPAAWVLCGILSAIILVIFAIIFARERSFL